MDRLCNHAAAEGSDTWHLTPDTCLILASGSPRRRDILTDLGIAFEVNASDVDEEAPDLQRLDPVELARTLARRKAEWAASRAPGRLVLGADTVVACDGLSLGKPVDAADARRMLAMLSGRRHQVITGVALVRVPGLCLVEHQQSEVTFHPLSAAEIEDYVATGEPMDKAGAYAIQGLGGKLVREVSGSYTNVVGLPDRLAGGHELAELIRGHLQEAVS